MYPVQDKVMNVRRLIDILDLSIVDDPHRLGYFEENGAPLLQLLRKYHSFAPEEVKDYMKKRLLPSERYLDLTFTATIS